MVSTQDFGSYSRGSSPLAPTLDVANRFYLLTIKNAFLE